MSKWSKHLLFFALGAGVSFIIQRVPWRADGNPLPYRNFAAAQSMNHSVPGRQTSPAPSAAKSTPTVDRPWGSIEVTPMPLEDPREVFLDHNSWLQRPKWDFAKFSRHQLAEFFDSCELREGEKEELLDATIWEDAGGGCAVFPSEDLILRLGSGSRQKIYSLLSKTEDNYPQHHPFRFSLDGFDRQFIGAEIPAEKLDVIRSLTYTNQNLLVFADVEPMTKILNLKEFRSMINALYSVPSVTARLRLKPDSNRDSLLRYWGEGGREDRIRPVLEALAKVAGGGTINVSYFMPPFPRLHLYTFPDPSVEPRMDCFYTALNFFNDAPNPQFLDPSNIRNALQTMYQAAHGDPHFGDLVVLGNQEGDAMHIAVLIADDIVFTKNGGSYLQPWVMMRISDMLASYPAEKPWNIFILRKKTTS